jgi:cytochrome c5
MKHCRWSAALVSAALCAPVGAADGRAVYVQTCAACHTHGVAGAPKLGDRLAWTPRLSGGGERLLMSVLRGKGAMPPKGGNANLSDVEVKAALDYMVANVQ